MTKRGRKRKVTPGTLKKMKKLRGEGLAYMKIAERLSLSYTTVYKYLKKKEEIGFLGRLRRKLGG